MRIRLHPNPDLANFRTMESQRPRPQLTSPARLIFLTACQMSLLALVVAYGCKFVEQVICAIRATTQAYSKSHCTPCTEVTYTTHRYSQNYVSRSTVNCVSQ